MSTVTKVMDEKASTVETIKYNSFQLNQPKKYVSIKNTIETKEEINNRSRDIHIYQEDAVSLYTVFLKSVLSFIQFMYIIIIAFKALYSYLNTLFTRYHMDIYQRIEQDKSLLTKIPNHLTIVISRELASTRTLKDWEKEMFNISMASCWAWEYGIKELSIYDVTGVMKSMATDLYKQQSNMLHEWMIKSEHKEPAIKFTILSSENGSEYMGKITQEISLNHDINEIDMTLVDKYIHKNNVSDPELMIVYNGLPHNYISLDGYNPWNIRLTEIANCSNLHDLNYTLFSKCLYRYSKVKQRFGR